MRKGHKTQKTQTDVTTEKNKYAIYQKEQDKIVRPST